MVEVLEVAWTAGMRSAGKDQKIVEVALQLQLQPEKVKEWIGNRNAKEARRQGGQTVKKSKILTKGPNAYSLFARSVERGSMDGKTYLQHVATEWRKKSNAAKETYAKQAEEIRADPFKGQDRQGVIAFNLKAIHAACDVLESVGFEIGGFGVDPTEEVNPVVFASRGALSFFSRKMQENFQTYVTGKTQVGSRELEKKDLEQLVRKQVNSAWAKTSTSTKCPYKDVKDGKVDVEIKGLLDNISLKDPSWYGIKTLKTMLDSNIEFKIRQNQQNQTIDEVVKTTQESKARNEAVKRTQETKARNKVHNSRVLEKPGCSTAGKSMFVSTVHNSTVLEKTGCNTAGTSTFVSTDANRNKDTNECTEDAKRKLEKIESSTEDTDLSSEDVALLSPLLLDTSKQELFEPTEDELYTIERIIKERKKKNNKTEVLVKWEGYSKPSWVDKTEIKNIDK